MTTTSTWETRGPFTTLLCSAEAEGGFKKTVRGYKKVEMAKLLYALETKLIEKLN
jgi:hypothetical protein